MVMRSLSRKLWRDLWKMKSQVITIALVISAGVASIVSSLSTYKSLLNGRDEFYIAGRFADAFTELKRAPLSSLAEFEEKHSIEEIQPRVVLIGRLWKGADQDPLTVRIQTYQNPTTDLNRLFLKQGRWPDLSLNEVVMSEAFFQGARFQLGEKIQVVAEGQTQTYTLVGVVLTPEFAYTLKPGAPLPDDAHFGVIWGDYKTISKHFGFERAYNSLAVRANRQSSLQQVIQDLDSVLEKYGGRGAYSRETQPSHFFVTDELRQQKVMARILPFIFLGVAAFLLNMILGRIVNSQREQIAILRALGYSAGQILLHYLNYIFVILLIGSFGGLALGYWQGSGMVRLYQNYFRFLELKFVWDWPAVLGAIALSFAFGIVAVLRVLYRLHQLRPAEAMRPETPTQYKGRMYDRVFRQMRLKPVLRMILRSLLSKPVRTLSATLGLSFSSVILILGIFWWDAVGQLMDIHFNHVLKADTIVSLVNPVSESALLDIRQISGVLRVEAYRQVPVRIRFKNQHVLTVLEGVNPHQELKALLDKNYQPVELPQEGLMLSRGWVDKLGVSLGDLLILETLETTKKTYSLPLTRVVEDLIGSQAYMKADLLQSLLQEGLTYNSLLLKLDPLKEEDIRKTLRRYPLVSSVDNKLDVLKSFHQSTAKVILIFAAALLFFAVLIAVGVIYNSARVSLSEKSTILASLRILGFTQNEVFAILLGEMVVLTTLSFPLGMAFGYTLAVLSVRLIHTESFRMPFYMEPKTFTYSLLIVALVSIATAFFVRRQLRSLDMVGTLKARE